MELVIKQGVCSKKEIIILRAKTSVGHNFWSIYPANLKKCELTQIQKFLTKYNVQVNMREYYGNPSFFLSISYGMTQKLASYKVSKDLYEFWNICCQDIGASLSSPILELLSICLDHLLPFLILPWWLVSYVKDPVNKKWSCPIRMSSVNVTRPVGNCGFGHVYWRNPLWKTSFFCAVFLYYYPAGIYLL